MKRVYALGLVISCASCASGAFDVRSVSLTTPDSPLFVVGTLFHAGTPGLTGPSGDSIESNPAWEYDSYVAIDTQPSAPGNPQVKGDGFQANPGDLAVLGDPFEVPNIVEGQWFMDPQGPRPQVGAVRQPVLGGMYGVFLGRFTFRTLDGSVPNGDLALGFDGMTVDIRDQWTTNVGSPATDSLLVHFSTFDSLVQQGTDGGDLSVHPMPNLYMLLKVVTLAGPRPGGIARWRVIDLYVAAIFPSPGTISLGLIAGLTAVRRHRFQSTGAYG